VIDDPNTGVAARPVVFAAYIVRATRGGVELATRPSARISAGASFITDHFSVLVIANGCPSSLPCIGYTPFPKFTGVLPFFSSG